MLNANSFCYAIADIHIHIKDVIYKEYKKVTNVKHEIPPSN